MIKKEIPPSAGLEVELHRIIVSFVFRIPRFQLHRIIVSFVFRIPRFRENFNKNRLTKNEKNRAPAKKRVYGNVKLSVIDKYCFGKWVFCFFKKDF